MNRLIKEFKFYHPLVWVIIFGTMFARAGSFMSLPFLTIYLANESDLSVGLIGLTVGFGAISGVFGGFFGGNLSDQFGRKKVLLYTLFVWAFVFIGFGMTTNVVLIILLNILNGLCRSFFEPTSQALLSDLTTEEKKMRVFSYRYMAINVGAAIGPLLGAYFALKSAGLTFIITGCLYLIYAIALTFTLNKFSNELKPAGKKEKVRISAAINVIRKDLALGFFILAGTLSFIGYAQYDSNLPLFMKEKIDNAASIYSMLLTINAIVVVIFQPFITKWSEKKPILVNMAIGTGLLCIGMLAFSAGFHWSIFVLGIIVFTLGEILIVPSGSLFIDKLAKGDLKGTYFGASNFRMLGMFIGPALGGSLLEGLGGEMMFIIISVLTAVSLIFYILGNKVASKEEAKIIEVQNSM
ncbi:MDR family MFS transporter [Priestia flexa]|uniref:MDR family MFS transporter n=1 Tax=Priestia flexa TaxID=86664 RepID=UPI0015868F3E|nr:MFS transporter [Priestia flexa]